jgi:hypothetical protein
VLDKQISKKWDFLFFILLISAGLLYSYYQVLFMRPYSIHQWRQCDGLSFALNYYYDGMHFFSPTIHYSGAADGRACPSEFPIIYYVAALLWKIFGYHEFIYRLEEIFLGFTGFYFLFKLAKKILKDGFWAILVSLFLFSSPIVAYYSPSFISDFPALCFLLIAWYFFYRFYKEEKNRDCSIAMLFFALAGLVKITALISFVPIVLIYLIELTGLYAFKDGEKIFKKPLIGGILLGTVLVLIMSWVKFIYYYNTKYFSTIFLTQPAPFWNATTEDRWRIMRALYNDLLPQFMNMPCLMGVFILFLFILVFNKRINKFLLWLCIGVFMGSITYIILWFQVLDVHDYYFIVLLIFIPLVLLTFLSFIKKEYPAVLTSGKIKLISAIIVVFSIYACAVKTQLKYSSSYGLAKYSFLTTQEEIGFRDWYTDDYEAHFGGLETITPYLRSLGISRTDKVLSIPDHSFNITLYLMDQKGYTDFGYQLDDNEGNFFADVIKKGVKYLVINDPEVLKMPWIQPFIAQKMGKYKNVTIYRL